MAYRIQTLTVPPLLMLPLGLGVTVLEQRVVVLQVEVMRLQPYTGRIDGITVSRKALMPLINVCTDVGDALDNLLLIVRHFAEIALSPVVAEDAAEICLVAIRSSGLVFVVHYRLYRLGHRLVIRRAHALDVRWKPDGLFPRQ